MTSPWRQRMSWKVTTMFQPNWWERQSTYWNSQHSDDVFHQNEGTNHRNTGAGLRSTGGDEGTGSGSRCAAGREQPVQAEGPGNKWVGCAAWGSETLQRSLSSVWRVEGLVRDRYTDNQANKSGNWLILENANDCVTMAMPPWLCDESRVPSAGRLSTLGEWDGVGTWVAME